MAVRTAYIFHTAFCCSTLLARCLARPGSTFLLIEPLALRDLADAARRGAVEDETIRLVLRLLVKPPTGESAVLIKPSNLVNNLAGRLLRFGDGGRAVMISSSLKDFIVSCIKKGDDTKARLPGLLAALCDGSDYLRRVGIRDIELLDFWALTAAIWHRHRLQLVEQAGDRLRYVSANRLLEQPHQVVARCARYLAIPAPGHEHVDAVLGRHAKAPEVVYDAAKRREEADRIIRRFSGPIEQAVDWFRGTLQERVEVRLPPAI